MLEDAAGIRRVVLVCGTVDLRKGIDGLAMIIGDNTTRIHLRKEHYFSFVENALIVAKGCYGWEQDFYSFTNVLKMDDYPGQEPQLKLPN